LWRESCDLARSLDVPLHAHLAQSLEEHAFSIEQRGAPPARWLASLEVLDGMPSAAFAHGIYVSRPELAMLDRTRDCLVYCPCSQLVFGFPADPILWEEAGLRWAVATDCASSNDSMNVQKELRHVAGLRTQGATWSREYREFLDEHGGGAGAAWSERTRSFERAQAVARPESLLARVWSVPGSLHPAAPAGVLEAGALANVVVWDPDHPSMWPGPGLSTLAMGDTTAAIHAMFVAGREVGQAGAFHRSLVDSDAYRQALLDASRRRVEIQARSA
jgi:cytosine/adenosine deaminase-related metal-dependent hydrolase